jgi:hypothetical protein
VKSPRRTGERPTSPALSTVVIVHAAVAVLDAAEDDASLRYQVAR